MLKSVYIASVSNYHIYILKCSDGNYYTGVTNDLPRRIAEHQDGVIHKAYTHNRRPVTLVYAEPFIDINQAIVREKQIKKWTKTKKEALINNREEILPELSLAYRDKNKRA